MAEYLFYFLSFLAIASGLMVVISRNPVHSVLYLIMTFFSLSGHYILLNAQFLAAVNIIVYAGAIMVLFLFVIMFLNMRMDSEPFAPLGAQLAAVVSGGLVLLVLVASIKESAPALDTPIVEETFDSQIGLVQTLGQTLFQKYLLPFELTSVLFLAAIVGAVLLGRREPNERNTF
jgi:NADH-quinone oxidoreductase subunit J